MCVFTSAKAWPAAQMQAALQNAQAGMIGGGALTAQWIEYQAAYENQLEQSNVDWGKIVAEKRAKWSTGEITEQQYFSALDADANYREHVVCQSDNCRRNTG